MRQKITKKRRTPKKTMSMIIMVLFLIKEKNVSLFILLNNIKTEKKTKQEKIMRKIIIMKENIDYLAKSTASESEQ